MYSHPDQDFVGKPGADKRGDSSPLSVDVSRLRESMDWSIKELVPFRERYTESITVCAGSRYGQTNLDKTPVNLMRLAVEIWLRQLVSQNPRSLVLTRSPALISQAYELELALNHTLKNINFGRSMSEVVRSAIFLFGVMKVGVAPKKTFRKQYHPGGDQVFADPVLVEDFIFDMNARRIEEWEWCANRYRLPLDEVRDNPDFDKTVRGRIRSESRNVSDTAFSGGDRASQISTSKSISDTEYHDSVELWDIWLPGDGLLVTMPTQAGLEPLRVREWEGPDNGPFHLLTFNNMPGNVVPSAPVQHLYDLQTLLTKLFNQLARQAGKQRTITLATAAAVADGTAQRIKAAQDGEIVTVTHTDQVRELRYGGADPQNLRLVMWLKDLFSYSAGNLESMGGLSQQGDTLGQEQLMRQSSSQMLRDMQTKVEAFTTNVLEDVAWYLYNDPIGETNLSKEIEGYGHIPFVWGPDRREADFFEYNFELSPYSLQNQGPEQRLGRIMQFAQQILIPLAPQMGQWGKVFNVDKFLDLISKYGDLPELSTLVSGGEMQASEGLLGSGGGGRALQSPVTTRNYTRKSIPGGGGSQGREAQMMNELAKEAQAQ